MTLLEYINVNEIRNWLLLILAFVGAFITITTYINSTRQRKIDNTFKTLEYLRRHIGNEQIETFIELFHANNELGNIEPNQFIFQDGRTDIIETMFSEGGCGNGDIHNMIEIFNLVSPTLNKLELNLIWFEYGQIMSKIYNWTKYLEDLEKNDNPNYLKDYSFSYYFNKFMDKNWEKLLKMSFKYYTYAE